MADQKSFLNRLGVEWIPPARRAMDTEVSSPGPSTHAIIPVAGATEPDATKSTARKSFPVRPTPSPQEHFSLVDEDRELTKLHTIKCPYCAYEWLALHRQEFQFFVRCTMAGCGFQTPKFGSSRAAIYHAKSVAVLSAP